MLELSSDTRYRTRLEVYFHPLKEFTDALVLKFGGRYIERFEVFGKAAYLIHTESTDEVLDWIGNNQDFELQTDLSDDLLKVYKSIRKVPSNEKGYYYYIQILRGRNILYVGLSESDPVKLIDISISFTSDGESTEYDLLTHSIVPGTVTLVVGELELTDDDGKFIKVDENEEDEDELIATIDYFEGKLSLENPADEDETISVTAKSYNF